MNRILETQEVGVGADRAWDVVGDFAGLALWVPGVDGLHCTDPGVGGVRSFLLAGHEMEERQIARDEPNRSYTYQLCRGPVPVTDYSATIAVTPLALTRSMVSWSAIYRPAGLAPEACERLLRKAYRRNLERLKDVLEGRAAMA